jgi:peptidoglycan-associated lipoprotein
MSRSRLLVIVGIAAALAACGKKTVHTPPAPVAPVAPPPAPAPAERARPAPVDEYERLKGMSAQEIDGLDLFGEIHFDFDRSDLREEDRALLEKNAEILRKFDFLSVTVEGHCDARGTVEYNLALGERRAKVTRDYLVSLGVPVPRLRSASYGKEAPLCRDSNEDCWARNRRAHFAVTGTAGGR